MILLSNLQKKVMRKMEIPILRQFKFPHKLIKKLKLRKQLAQSQRKKTVKIKRARRNKKKKKKI